MAYTDTPIDPQDRTDRPGSKVRESAPEPVGKMTAYVVGVAALAIALLGIASMWFYH